MHGQGKGGDNKQQQQKASDNFWKDAQNHAKSYTDHRNEDKEKFRQQTFDEFDEFFDFKRQAAESGIARDDTRGADYTAEV